MLSLNSHKFVEISNKMNRVYPLPDAEEERDVRGHEDEDERDGDAGVVATLQLKKSYNPLS